MTTRSWDVLVLLGASGSGKSTVASEIARRCEITWMQVDDLRLALQYSKATLPEHNDALYWFLERPDFVLLPRDEVVQAFVGTARAMMPAVRVAIDSHVVTGVPMVIEGDGIHPDLVLDPVLAEHVASGAVRFCLVRSGFEDDLLENMVRRDRGMDHADHERARRYAGHNHAFEVWLDTECRSHGIPVVDSRPYETLADRILDIVRLPISTP